MEDYEYYHADDEATALIPDPVRPPRMSWEEIAREITLKKWPRQKLIEGLAKAMYVIERRNARELAGY